jgi:UDP-N-acetyl-D-glucosamine dehydrogenase
VARRIADALNDRGKPVRGSRILGIGVTYKPDVGDIRESASTAVLERLAAAGAKIAYHDPFVRELQVNGSRLRSRPLTNRVLSEQECVAVLTAHTNVDYERVVAAAKLVFDARGVTSGVQETVVRL